MSLYFNLSNTNQGHLNFYNAIHISDVHIRLVSRIEEYKIIFEKLYERIDQIKKSHPLCVIVLCGDILHSKLQLSPECINLCYSFFPSYPLSFQPF